MNRLAPLLTFCLCLTTTATCTTRARAQDAIGPSEKVTSEDQQEWYYKSENEKVKKRTIAQQKSQKRAEQRMARLEAMRWYGFSAGRPTASGMPFTSSYSPTWTRPGGRPFAWYLGSSPSVVINRPYRAYRY